MDIRSFLHQKKENRAKKIWEMSTGAIIVIFMVWIVWLNKTSSVQNIEHFIWEKVSVSGTIFVDNNYPTNTHKLSNMQESFWLKESRINLNNFLETEVLIEWNISEITAKYPILIINKLKIPAYKLSISENRFFYTDKLISFDFSKDIDVYSKKNWWEIVLYYQNEPMLRVDTFICSNITETQNCEKLKNNYIANLNETFESLLWYTFYRNGINSRVAFNDSNLWYIFTVDSDGDMLNLSHLINIVDSKFVLNNKKDFVLSGCSTQDIKMTNITKLDKWIIDDDLVRLHVTWHDLSWQEILCKLNIDIFDDWEITNASVNFVEK